MPTMTVKGAIQASLAAFATVVKAAIPTKVSDLDNDSGFITDADVVTGVKGASESSYRTGDVSISPADIGLSASDIFLAAHPIGSYYIGPDPSSIGGTWVAYYPSGLPPMWRRTA